MSPHAPYPASARTRCFFPQSRSSWWVALGLALLAPPGQGATPPGVTSTPPATATAAADADAGATPLMLAAREGHDDVVARLLEQGADPEHSPRPELSPLACALGPTAARAAEIQRWSQSVLAPAVLERRAIAALPFATPAPESTGLQKWQALQRSQASYYQLLAPDLAARKARIVSLLLHAGAKPRSSPTLPLLCAAIGYGHPLSTLQMLLDAGADPNDAAKANGMRPLHQAITAGRADAVALLLARGANVEALMLVSPSLVTGMHPIAGGLSALGSAIAQERLDLVVTLLAHGAQLEATNQVTARPLHFAAYLGHADIVQHLLERGARASVRDRWSCTPLHYASHNGHLAVVRLLLARQPEIEARDEAGYTPLLSAVENNHTAILTLLHEHGASLECRAGNGNTPLDVAALNNSVASLRYLLDHGAKPDGPSGSTSRPLHRAASSGAADVVALLVERGADLNAPDPNLKNATPLHFCVLARPKVVFQLRPELARHPVGTLRVRLATDATLDAIARQLVAAGAALDAPNRDGNTPLHLAAYYGDAASAHLLLQLGAARSARNRQGRTPDQLAAERGHAEIARLLQGIAIVDTHDPTPAAPAPPAAEGSMRRKATEALRYTPPASQVAQATLDHLRPTTGSTSGATPASAEQAQQEQLVGLLLAESKSRQAQADLTGALRCCDQALELQPAAVPALSLRGYLRFLTLDLSGAQADLERVLTLQPNLNTGLVHRAHTRLALGDGAGAAADYTTALARNPQLPGYVHLYRYVALGRAGRADEAAHLLRTASAEWKPGNFRTLARALLGEISPEELLALADRADEKSAPARRCEAFYFAGVLAQLRGDAATARARWETAVATRQVSNHCYAFARAALVTP